ncbi:hypothetical protein [Streptococcus sp. DD13]|uniref:hypothetical protein n=1 Tax=Streptococcus sp. DD13 TaxID=1777881 RepID=UPI0008345A0B|nr:hypothetical protein [Streptococcus sp. DD13]
MEIIKENLRRCDAFYQSDFYQFLEKNHPNYIPYLFIQYRTRSPFRKSEKRITVFIQNRPSDCDKLKILPSSWN